MGKVKGQMGPLSPRTTVVRLRLEIPVEMIPCAPLWHVALRAGPEELQWYAVSMEQGPQASLMGQSMKPTLRVACIVEVSLMERYVGMMPCVHPMHVFKIFVNQTRVPLWRVATWIVTAKMGLVASPTIQYKLPRFAVQVVLLLGKVKVQMENLIPKIIVLRFQLGILVEMIPCVPQEHVPLRAGL